MGTFNCVDVVTGLSLREDDEAVALVIGRRVGGYPDAERSATKRQVGPTEAFAAASLPIRGRVGDHGDFVPAPGQASVSLALAMTGTKSWAAFEREATDFSEGDGVVVGRRAKGEGRRELLGVTHFSAATWARLVAPVGEQDVEAELSKVMPVLRDAARVVARGRPEPSSGASEPSAAEISWHQANEILSMRQSGPWTQADGTRRAIPHLTGILSDGRGPEVLHDTFRTWLTFGSDALRVFRKDAVEPPKVIVRGLLQVNQAMLNLDILGRSLRPAQTARGSNAEPVADLALETLEAAMRQVLDRLGHHDDDRAVPRVRAMLARIDDVRLRVARDAEAAHTTRQDWLRSHGIPTDDEAGPAPGR